MTVTYQREETVPTSLTEKPFADEQEETARLGQMVECARTQAEAQAATEALRAWFSRHPEQVNRLEGVFEYLYLREESAREAQAEAEAMGLSPDEIAEREQVVALRRRVRAEDAAEVFAPALRTARTALEAWQAKYPEDPMNCYLQEALETEAEVAHALQERA